MAEIDETVIRQIENKIRDMINLIEVMKQEEEPGATQKIEDEAAENLKQKLREIAVTLGVESI